MNVSLIQTTLHWEEREKNLSHFDTLINRIEEPTDLIVLPEMFTTGFTMNPEKVAENWNRQTLAWMKKKAHEKNCVITGSVAVEEEGKYYNRLFWVKPGGDFSSYNKRHLFRMAKEDQHYATQGSRLVENIKGWNICPLVCYDLRFPVWSRNRFNKTSATWDYDVLIYVANWPEVRNYPWKQLLVARAIENQCYVIGLNRVGTDGNGYDYSGDSALINPRGEIISTMKAHEEKTETLTLSKDHLDEFRKLFPVGLDADDFKLL